MIGENPVIGDVGEFIDAEQLLVGHDIGGALDGPGEVGVGAERPIPVFRSPLDAVVFALLVVERGEHVGGAELAVVEQVLGDLVIAVDADQEIAELLRRANVEDMRPLRQHRTVLEHLRLRGRVDERKCVGRAGERLQRRREVARIAGMDFCPIPGRVDHVQTGAELVGVNELPHLVEPEAEVERQLVGQSPLVLQVESGDPSDLADRDR